MVQDVDRYTTTKPRASILYSYFGFFSVCLMKKTTFGPPFACFLGIVRIPNWETLA